MKHLITTFLFLLLFTSFLSAQTNYQAAHIITLAGEKVDGFIDYQEWKVNPQKILFKTSESGNSLSYGPLDIQSFYVAGENYEGKALEIDKSPYRFENLPSKKEIILVRDTIFLRLLVSGEASLYDYKDENGKDHYFISTQKNGFKELTIEKFKTESNRVVSVESYKGVLNYIFFDSKKAKKKIRFIKLLQSDLIKIVTIYNTDKSSESIIFKSSRNRFKPQFGVIGGYASTEIIYTTSLSDLSAANIDWQTRQPSIGLSFIYIFPRLRGKLSVSNDLIYHSFTAESAFTESLVTQTRNKTLNFDYHYLHLSHSLRYTQPGFRIRPYIQAGFLSGFALKLQQDLTTIRDFGGNQSPTTNKGEVYSNTQKLEVGYTIAIGAAWKKISTEFRYSYGSGMVNTVSTATRRHTLSGLVAYYF